VIPDVAQLRRRARRLLPPTVYDYYAGGSGRERTLRANEQAWRQVWLAPRVLRGVTAVDTRAKLLGTEFATPLAVAPTGYHGLAHPDGELATAAGAAAAGALFVLSTRSSRRIEEVAEVTRAAGGAWWFQVYLMRDRELTAGLVRRAVAAGAAALVLTADTPVVGRKRRNSEETARDRDFLVNLGPLADLSTADQAADVAFTDIGWLRDLGGGVPVVVKGVLRTDDAGLCRDQGAAAVIVSNHGGRQLDGALPSAIALPGVAGGLRAAADPEVYADGGVRTAEDALAALALGARAVFLGRPALWALTCGGAEGVRSLIAGLTDDLAHAMTLAGTATIADTAGIAWPGGAAAGGGQPR
jgi:4-hydroxymandelate oxidase